jgi:hypothetical protein
MGVRFVITTQQRSDLQLAGSTDEANLYRVPEPAPRAQFFSVARTAFEEEPSIPDLFAADPRGNLLLPSEARVYLSRYEVPAAYPPETGKAVRYARPWSDEIRLQTNSSRNGFAEVLEAYDPGWTALVDGVKAPLVPADGFAMGVPVAAGSHEVLLRYRTVGRATGIYLSFLSAGLLVLLVGSAKFPTLD